MIAPAHDAATLLDKQFLEMRCELLNLAAALDRIERAAGADKVVTEDERLQRLRTGLQIVLTPGTTRAEQIQLLFSDPYISGWNQSSK